MASFGIVWRLLFRPRLTLPPTLTLTLTLQVELRGGQALLSSGGSVLTLP